MHPEALAWVGSLNLVADRVVEFGSRNVNGTARDAIVHNEWYGIDIEPGDGVDSVADCSDLHWMRPETLLVVCVEMLEHCSDVAGVFRSAREVLLPGGLMVITCATDGRGPHSAVDGGPLRDGEYYGNVKPFDAIPGFEIAVQEVHEERGDLYLLLRKR